MPGRTGPHRADGERLGLCNIRRVHLPFQSVNLELIKREIALGREPHPHIRLNHIAWELLGALHISLAKQ